jgi:arsenate reductase (glutaredoxin)
MYILYGIPNCDTTKKAIHWLNAHQLPYRFHDYKQAGISKEKLNAWCAKAGWEMVLNKRSTTWRELPAAEQQNVKDQATAVQLMQAHITSIKRPILETGTAILIGFSEKQYQSLLSKT